MPFFGPALAEATGWLERYRARMAGEGERAALDAVNPKYVLRNWVAEIAIRAVEDQGEVPPRCIFRILQARLKA